MTSVGGDVGTEPSSTSEDEQGLSVKSSVLGVEQGTMDDSVKHSEATGALGHQPRCPSDEDHAGNERVTSPSDVGSGGQSSSSFKIQEESLSSMVSTDRPDRQEVQTVRYSSPVSNSFTDATLSCSKDIRDPCAVHGSSGLYNLGNTCFMNAGLQCLTSTASLVKFLLEDFVLEETNKNTLLGQFYKLVCKMWCGQFSVIHPKEFKDTLGLYHSQFQDYRQHDCQEFLALLLDTFHEQLNTGRSNLAALSNNEAVPGCSPLHVLEPLSNSLNNQDSSPLMEMSNAGDDQTPDETLSCDNNHVTSSHSQSKPSVFVNKSHGELNVATGPKTGSECISSTTVNNSSMFSSEDSNQSTVSLHSTDSEQSLNIKKLQLQSTSDVGRSEEDVTMGTVSSSTDSMDKNNHRTNINICNTNTSMLNMTAKASHLDAMTDHNAVSSKSDHSVVSSKTDNLAQLNNICSSKLPSSLLEYYGKETKTLNTNVLVNEAADGEIAIDSDKFAKQDNRRPVQEEVNILQEVLGEEAKADKDVDPVNFGIKDTNLRVEKKSRFLSKSCPNVLDSERVQDVYELNNIKRIKIDSAEPSKHVSMHESEKNVQMQEMSKFNTQKVLDEEMSDGESSAESMDAEEAESSEDEGDITSRSSSVNALSLDASFVNNRAEIYQEEADAAWNDYLRENNSVVVSKFQGQFQSTVVCSVCRHVSVTYEPFMYLSLPIPRAMERQICVIFVHRGMPPTRYLLNMHKTDKVHKLKRELLRLLHQPDCDIILAEVLDSHVSRVLDDNVMLRYVNDTSRKIYAFEMVQPCLPPEESPDNKQEPAVSSVTSSLPSSVTRSVAETATSSDAMTDSSDIFSNMDTFSNQPISDSLFHSSRTAQASMVTVDPELGDDFPESKSWSRTKSERETPHPTSPELPFTETDMGKETPDLAGTGLWEWSQVGFPDCDSTWDNVASSSDFNPPPIPQDVINSIPGIADQWRTCAICLEELSDNDLLTHESCSGTFCQNCLEMSAKHTTEAGYCCPICLMPANMMEDFSPLVSANCQKPKLRVIAIPIAFRCDVNIEDNSCTEKLFGHPTILYVPNRLPGACLYDMIDAVLPFPAMYSVVLTDGQGLRCSRCMYTAHCTGCVLCREGEVTLQPGDNLTIHIMDMSHDQQQEAAAYHDHASMQDLRPNDPITVYDCFRAFTESEILDEHNPWYCPTCQQNQCAKKTMTVWRYPDTLIVHLKRFVFHELSSTKVDNPVVFPHKDLDLQQFVSGPKVKDLSYDLYSIVCHFGGSHSGHYTSYTNHPLTSEWFYYNDETVTKQEPRNDDYSSAYVLFYQRKGTSSKFQPPAVLPFLLDDPSPLTSPAPLTVDAQPGPCTSETHPLKPNQPEDTPSPSMMDGAGQSDSTLPAMDNMIGQSDDSPMSVTQPPVEQVEADSTFDFYS
ncbi:uncharacterized protein [Haliotis asinina]|uniref:uncharacterized protein n=1 Tax=Haliotis asinina TaxID=109174 RepID=UPI003532729E